jgi:hypothetical protein
MSIVTFTPHPPQYKIPPALLGDESLSTVTTQPEKKKKSLSISSISDIFDKNAKAEKQEAKLVEKVTTLIKEVCQNITDDASKKVDETSKLLKDEARALLQYAHISDSPTGFEVKKTETVEKKNPKILTLSFKDVGKYQVLFNETDPKLKTLHTEANEAIEAYAKEIIKKRSR